MNKKILLVGSANMDLALNMHKMPNPGETIIDDGGIAYIPGGKGANSAIAFARLGADCALCTKLGADLHGQKLLNYYKEQNLNTSYIKLDNNYSTGLAAVMREYDGTNRIVVYPGANNHITKEIITEAFNFEPDALYIGFEVPFDTSLSAAKIAVEKDIPIFVDAAPANKEHPLETLPEVEIFSPNETETFEYTGIIPTDSESALRAAIALYKRVKCKYIVIKQGARGAFFYDGNNYDMIPAFKADKVVDTTAAGDSFTAAMTLEYLITGGDIKQAITYGAAAGAISVSRPGASTSIPTNDEVRAFMRKRGK